MSDIPRVKIDTDAEIEWIRLINRVSNPDNANAVDHVNLGIVNDALVWVDDVGNVFTASGSTSFDDSTFEIYDNADPTKIAKFQASGISAATTRTFTFPDADTTLVGTDATQTLTNKSISANQITAGTFTAGSYIFQRSTSTGIPLVVQSTDDSSTNPILRIANSAAANLSHFDYRGALIIGAKFSQANDIMNSTLYNVNNTSGTYVAVGGQIQFTGTSGSTATLHGFWFDVGTAAAATANLSGLVGMRTNLQMRSSSSSLTSYMGWYSRGTWSTGITSTVTNFRHVYLEKPALGTGPGVITNLYGMYIDDMNVASTLNFSIVTNAGNIVFNESGDANTDFRVEGDANTHLFFTDASVEMVGINQSSLGGKLDINQSSTTFAQPVLKLTQSDVSEEFVRYVGTAANATLTQSLVDAGDVGSFTPVGYKKVYIQDDGNQIVDGAYYVQFGTLA